MRCWFAFVIRPKLCVIAWRPETSMCPGRAREKWSGRCMWPPEIRCGRWRLAWSLKGWNEGTHSSKIAACDRRQTDSLTRHPISEGTYNGTRAAPAGRDHHRSKSKVLVAATPPYHLHSF